MGVHRFARSWRYWKSKDWIEASNAKKKQAEV